MYEKDVGFYGGSVALADYCPYIQEFTWRSNNVVVRGSHCMYEENNPSKYLLKIFQIEWFSKTCWNCRSRTQLCFGELWWTIQVFWSHWQDVGRNELRTSSSVAALGLGLLPLPLQEWSLAYRSDEPDLHLLLSATRTPSQSLGPFLAPFRITGLSLLWRDLWDRIPQKRRKMSAGDDSDQEPSLLFRFHGLWSPLNSWNNNNHVDPLLGHYFVPLVIGQLLLFSFSWSQLHIPYYIQLCILVHDLLFCFWKKRKNLSFIFYHHNYAAYK